MFLSLLYVSSMLKDHSFLTLLLSDSSIELSGETSYLILFVQSAKDNLSCSRLQHPGQSADNIIATIRWPQIDALDQWTGLDQQFLGKQQTFIMSMVASQAHALAYAIRDGETGYLVMQIFGMA